jgi:hypothetical protein
MWRGELMHDITSSISQARHSHRVDAKHVACKCSLDQLIWLSGTGLNVGQDRLLLGREALMFHGFPVAKVEPLLAEHAAEFTDSFLMDVAANMTDLLVLSAVLSSALASISWASAGSQYLLHCPSTTDDLDDASEFLSGLASLPEPSSAKQKKRRIGSGGKVGVPR